MSSWQNSNRRDRLPPDWPQRRKYVLRRDHHECQTDIAGEICGAKADQVDHIRPGDDHSYANLEAICEWCHGRKSSKEGNAARRKVRQEIADRFRNSEDHPGLL